MNLLGTTGNAKTYRRVQALLGLDQGQKIQSIAERLQVTRFTIANWRDRFLQRRSLPCSQWFVDAPRSGRPRKGEGRLDQLVDQVIGTNPDDFGYQSTTWTAPLLVQYLDEFHRIEVVAQTVRRALTRLEICWKRPRHTLAAQSPTWRQAKGG